MTATIIGGTPVPVYPTIASLPAAATAGSLAVVLENDSLYEFNAAHTWAVIGPGGGGGGSGTVTSVGLSEGSSTPIYVVSGSPVTTSGTLSLTLDTQAANEVFAGPATGADAEPTFRALVTGDIPDLSAVYVTSVNGAQGAVTVNAINQLTGDVTAGPATSSQSKAATIAANAVTNAKLAQAAATTLKGNNTGSTANVADLTPSQVKAILAIVSGDVAYTPAVSGNWTVQPTTVAEALDWIASRSGML